MTQTHLAFQHLRFGPYKFEEYPKWVKDCNGQDVIVQDRSEEDAVASPATTEPAEEAVSPANVETVEVAVEQQETVQEPAVIAGDDDDKDDTPDASGDNEDDEDTTTDAKPKVDRDEAKRLRAAERRKNKKKA